MDSRLFSSEYNIRQGFYTVRTSTFNIETQSKLPETLGVSEAYLTFKL